MAFKLEVQDFMSHVVIFSRETFQTFAWKFLLCFPQKVFGVYVFPYFVLVSYMIVQNLVKTFLRRIYTFFVLKKQEVIFQR